MDEIQSVQKFELGVVKLVLRALKMLMFLMKSRSSEL
jgi:hypothetical protein